MKLGTGNRRQAIMAGVLGVLALGACIYLYEEVFASPTPTPAAAPAVVVTAPASVPGDGAVAGRAAKAVGTTSGALDPTLHMDAMLVSESVEYSGSGRNIFSAASAPPPVVIQKPVAPARLTPVAAAPLPVRLPPAGPPPPPPIELKFFGVEISADGTKMAFLLHNDDVLLASPGDIVLRRYKVISIAAKSIDVLDMQYTNTQTLPLLAN